MNIKVYSDLIQILRTFFVVRGFVEVPAQSRLSILAACEDPFTISEFTFANKLWPLPQTGQMQLEYELLTNPGIKGVFCSTTSYRNEPYPIPGRHDLIFPMFEFESAGNFAELLELEDDLCKFLGFKPPMIRTYEELCDKFNAKELGPNHEAKMQKEYEVCTIINFPESTHPFWNMKKDSIGTYNKADVILGGMETIGSAERECDSDKMRERFLNISDGEYAKKLYSLFGEDRVNRELNDYLSLSFFERFGGGIGLTRLAKAWEQK